MTTADTPQTTRQDMVVYTNPVLDQLKPGVRVADDDGMTGTVTWVGRCDVRE